MNIIKSLRQILLYVVPGYIGLSFFRSVSRINLSEHTTLIASYAYSYLSLALTNLIFENANENIQIIISSLICLAVGCGLAKALQSKKCKDFLFNHLHYSPLAGPWEVVFDYEKGTRIRALIGDGENEIVFVGTLEAFGNIPSYPWIAVSYYSFYAKLDSNEPYYEQKKGTHHLMVNLQDLKWVELWDDNREQ